MHLSTYEIQPETSSLGRVSSYVLSLLYLKTSKLIYNLTNTRDYVVVCSSNSCAQTQDFLARAPCTIHMRKMIQNTLDSAIRHVENILFVYLLGC